MKRNSEIQHNSKSRRILNEIHRAAKSREHTEMVKLLNRQYAARMRKGGPEVEETPAEIGSFSLDENELEAELDDSLSEVESKPVEPEPEQEPEVEPETEVSTVQARKRRPVAVQFVQLPRLTKSSVRSLISGSTSWRFCGHCSEPLHASLACRNSSLPDHYHLHCVELAIIAKID